MKLLKDHDAITAIPEEHRAQAMRLPIKIDLRDFSAWLSKKDPFSPEQNGEPPVNWHKSLESFIAALISFHSGGTNFTTDDLLAVIRISAILFVFDGLDEVADIGSRHDVVEELEKGIQRLVANAASLQTVVTSRPAAFANSPGMTADKYPYLHLSSLTRPLIDLYADRWLKARRIDSREAAEFKRTLREKLDQPHLRDLARNPMQLAILLSLITTRGTSLPDKRTALYDNYVDLFFNREAEKSAIVREHRDLLIEIHRYLAWLLHSEAERGGSGAHGSISQARLQAVLRSYLEKEGYDPSWAEALFAGMVERVVALVSRVEGTFEFEVQPLREYFAARFLYDTAPYSPPGGEQRGTKPDRFDALARNFYWTNVTRFYAGCFSKGELPGLVERLQELIIDEKFRLTTHPRMLGATLLSDWVFTQNPKSVQAVVGLILDGIGLRYLVAAGSAGRRRRRIWNPVVLPTKCGNDQLVSACFEILTRDSSQDYVFAVIELLRANAPISDLIKQWLQRFEHTRRLTWLDYGVQLGVLPFIELNELDRLVDKEIERAAPILYRGRRLDFFEASEQRFNLAVCAILNGSLKALSQRRVESALDALAQALNINRYGFALRERVPIPLSELFEQRYGPSMFKWSSDLATNTEGYMQHKNCMTVAGVAEEESRRSAAEWASELEPWSRVVETSRQMWGDQWAIYCLANLAAGIKSTKNRGKDGSDLLDDSCPLCPRARHARLKSANKSWWQAQFQVAALGHHREFLCLVALSWAKPEVLVSLIEVLDENLRKLSQDEWSRLFRAVGRTAIWGYSRPDERGSDFGIEDLPSSISPRTVVALASRGSAKTSRGLYVRCLEHLKSTDNDILEFMLNQAADAGRFGTEEWSPDLNNIRKCYSAGAGSSNLRIARTERRAMPIEMASTIASCPNSYPTALLEIAIEVCTRAVASNARPVATVADDEGWFGQPRPGCLLGS